MVTEWKSLKCSSYKLKAFLFLRISSEYFSTSVEWYCDVFFSWCWKTIWWKVLRNKGMLPGLSCIHSTDSKLRNSETIAFHTNCHTQDNHKLMQENYLLQWHVAGCMFMYNTAAFQRLSAGSIMKCSGSSKGMISSYLIFISLF